MAPDRPRLVVPRTPPPPPRGTRPRQRRRRWLWLAAGLVLTFAVPFVLADTLELGRRAGAAEDVPAPDAQARQVSVYFLRGEALAPAWRTIEGAAVATEAVRALLAGPTAAERETGLGSTIPAETSVRSVAIAGGTATVDLTGAFETGGGSLSMAARLAQVTYTLTQFPTVSRVVYELDGVPLTVLGGEGILLEEPQTRALYEQGTADSLDGSLLGPVFVDSPAQGAPFASPLRVTGSATGPFMLTVTDWDGRIVAEEEVDAAAGARDGFDVTLLFEPGLYPRGALIASSGDTVVEIPLGR